MRSDPRVESSGGDRYIFRLEEEKCEPDKNDKTEPCQQRIAIESVLHILNSKPPTIEQPSGLDSTFCPLKVTPPRSRQRELSNTRRRRYTMRFCPCLKPPCSPSAGGLSSSRSPSRPRPRPRFSLPRSFGLRRSSTGRISMARMKPSP